MSEKPREFWISLTPGKGLVPHVDWDRNPTKEMPLLTEGTTLFHVIEKSAYDEAEKYADRCTLELADAMKTSAKLRANLELAVAAIEKHLGRKTRGYPTPQEWEKFCSELKNALDEVKEQG